MSFKISREVRVGLLAALCLFLLYFGFKFLKGVNIFNPIHSYTGRFVQANGLVEQAPVYVRGYKVGQVETITYDFAQDTAFTVVVSLNRDILVTEGSRMLQNFAMDICGCKGDWTPDSFIETTVEALRRQIGPEKVILGLSGGVDSSVVAALIHRSPVQIQGVDELPNSMGALYDREQDVIFVRRGMEAHDIFRSLSKELAHAELAYTTPDYNRQDAAFAAYSVSYVVCKRYGIDVSGYDFSRMPERFKETEPKDIRAELSAICDAAKEITGRMHRALEKDKAPKNKEQER